MQLTTRERQDYSPTPTLKQRLRGAAQAPDPSSSRNSPLASPTQQRASLYIYTELVLRTSVAMATTQSAPGHAATGFGGGGSGGGGDDPNKNNPIDLKAHMKIGKSALQWYLDFSEFQIFTLLELH